MAAAEYYNTSAAQTAPQQSPYQQSPYQRPHELPGTSVPQYTPYPGPPNYQQSPPPPPYYSPNPSQNSPAVHFAPSAQNLHPQRPSGPNSSRPSFSSSSPPRQGQYLKPPVQGSPRPQSQPHSYHGSPAVAAQAPHMRPHMHANPSEYSLTDGYASDPESRRRHRRHSNRENDSSRDLRPPREHGTRSTRSRSTNADGFLGAAGGGLIGDLIFPGLGTVGGAVAGWIGGKDYGRHRKNREEKLHREQTDWEHKFRSRSHSGDNGHEHGHHGHHGHQRSPRRHKDEY